LEIKKINNQVHQVSLNHSTTLKNRMNTRNRNTPGNFALHVRANDRFAEYTLYRDSQYGMAADTRMPGNGLTPGQIPASQLSRNAVDIESFLFGVGSTDMLAAHRPCLTPQPIPLATANLWDSRPTRMPISFAVPMDQRPFPIP
jgi:hypothetical protein